MLIYSELIVKIIDVQDPLKVQLLAGHSKAVRSATWSPNGNYLVRIFAPFFSPPFYLSTTSAADTYIFTIDRQLAQ